MGLLGLSVVTNVSATSQCCAHHTHASCMEVAGCSLCLADQTRCYNTSGNIEFCILREAIMAVLPSNNGLAAVTRSRAAVCKPLCAFRSASKATKTTRTSNKRSVTLSEPEPDAVASSKQYLALTGLSALAGSALTLAPQNVWQLLGSRTIQDVTLTSSEVQPLQLLHCTAAGAAAGSPLQLLCQCQQRSYKNRSHCRASTCFSF
jgi:hypothetical protein